MKEEYVKMTTNQLPKEYDAVVLLRIIRELQREIELLKLRLKELEL